MITRYRAPLTLAVAALACFLSPVLAGDGAPVSGQRTFDTPEALVEAMIQAAENNDDDAIRALAGPQYADLVQPGGDPSVAKVRAEFAANARIFWKLQDQEDGSKTLVIGDQRWPFPVPLRKGANGWVLDVEAGKHEILARRIGRNELDAIRLCRLYAAAQEEYFSKDRDGDGVKEYAQRVKSTPGAQDGLYWDDPTGDDPSPFGPLVAEAAPYLQKRLPTDPVGGYYWRILKYQGPCAPGGSYGYVINGNMIAGYALIGYPAGYRDTGVMTFMVSNHGDVVQRDFGPNTASIVRGLLSYNPDAGWQKVED